MQTFSRMIANKKSAFKKKLFTSNGIAKASTQVFSACRIISTIFKNKDERGNAALNLRNCTFEAGHTREKLLWQWREQRSGIWEMESVAERIEGINVPWESEFSWNRTETPMLISRSAKCGKTLRKMSTLTTDERIYRATHLFTLDCLSISM